MSSEVNYPDSFPQGHPPTHLSLSCNSRVKIDVNVYFNTTKNDIILWKVIQASSAHLPDTFGMVNYQVIIILWFLREKFENVITG